MDSKLNNKKKVNPIYPMVFVGVMAAMVFVTTYFIKIPITTPAGPTMLKISNIICLLGGMLFGGLYGGLAAGIGSMIYDLLDPLYIASAPFTLVFFFTMAFVCGIIANHGGRRGLNIKWNIAGAICGAAAYWVLNIGKSIIVMIIAGSGVWPAIVANSAKMVTSGVNAVIAVVGSVLLAIPLGMALRKSGMMEKIGK